MGKFVLFLSFFLLSCGKPQTLGPVFNGWVSSGGENISDHNNPWWVKNTKEVSYCIDIDESSISATPEKIDRVIQRALRFWGKQFSRTTHLIQDFNEDWRKAWNVIGVATQTFKKMKCDGNEDLRFQFGHGTLSNPQKDYLKDIRRFIGVAVRTSYDPVNLKGKGFVYIGSDRGPYRVSKSENPRDIWNVELALNLAVIHELGHVFGLPHIGSPFSLMGGRILEIATDPRVLAIYEKLPEPTDEITMSYFMPMETWDNCAVPDDLLSNKKRNPFFEMDDSLNCLHFRSDTVTKEIKIYGYSSKEPKVSTEIGKFTDLSMNSVTSPGFGIMLTITPEQRVFELKNTNYVGGPYIVLGEGGGRLVLKSGVEKPVHLILGPSQFSLSAEFEGKFQTLIRWFLMI